MRTKSDFLPKNPHFGQKKVRFYHRNRSEKSLIFNNFSLIDIVPAVPMVSEHNEGGIGMSADSYFGTTKFCSKKYFGANIFLKEIFFGSNFLTKRVFVKLFLKMKVAGHL